MDADRHFIRKKINKIKKNVEFRLKGSRRRLLISKEVRKGRVVYALMEVIRKNGVITHRTDYDFYIDKEKLITEIITRSFQISKGAKDGANQAKRSKMYAVQ